VSPEKIPDHIEELNLKEQPTVPRPAASVILLRRGGKHESRGIEVLFGKRTPNAKFMPNVWVFPGGAVDPASTGEEPTADDFKATALRELEEEASVSLDESAELVPFSRWITPREVKVRYDTHFFLALAPPHCSPEPDRSEIVEVGWFAPSDALERHADGKMLLVFPTIKNLEELLPFGSAEEAMVAASTRMIEPILPKVGMVDGVPGVLLPGDHGYDDA
jgi:8-oxo-dGTP pyrophosphatase MutT (NUDIX family)